MSIFTDIKRQVIRSANEAELTNTDDICFTVKSKYFPSGVIGWFYKQGIFAVKEVNKVKEGNKWVYTVSIKDLDRENDLFKNANLRGRMTKDEDDGLYKYYTSNDTTSTDAYMSPNKEKLAPEDNCLLDLKLQACGFESLEEFYQIMGEGFEARQTLEDMYKEFLTTQVAPEWSYTEEEVEA